MSTNLGNCEVFISELHRSNLIERGQLDQLLEDFLRRQPQPDPNRLAEHLISRGVLTKFQADRVQQGKGQGLVLGHYVLTDAIGAGSMGTVHKANSKTDGKCYAVKVLPRRSMWNVRLARRQVRAFSQFSNPSVVPFVDVGTSGGLHYLVWDFVEGETLDALVKRLGRLDANSAAQVGHRIASGLAAAQNHGLFHGLLKCSNIMIGSSGAVRILDFGIGSLLAENEGESLVDTMSTANTLTSGLDCASPESILEPTNRTSAGDQYSLGCILYYCLSGQYPFGEGSAVEKMMAHQFKQPTPLTELVPNVPAELAGVVQRLMGKKPEDRYAAIDEAVEMLSRLYPANSPLNLRSGSHHGSNSRHSQSGTRPSASVPPSPLVNPDLVPGGFRRGNATPAPAAPLPVATMAPPLPAPVAAVTQVPTRRSMQKISAVAPEPPRTQPAAPVPMLQHESFPLLPDMVAAPSQRPAAAPAAEVPQPMMGPIGFLMLGATAAVAAFVIMHQIIK